ncbi:archease [Marinobacteraceae bacterium S3BR75-40.1]
MSENSGYQFLEDIAIADVAFRAWAPDLSGLFEQAAQATIETMLPELMQLRATEHRPVELNEAALDMLLFDFLQELIYYKDAERLLLLPQTVAVTGRSGDYQLKGILYGEPIDPRRHGLNADVKAVTLYRFEVKQTDSGWEATVVLDV